MNGKELRRMHRAAMFYIGGLVQAQDNLGKKTLERTTKYVPLREWLRTHENKEIQKAALAWVARKQKQKPRRRIVGPNDPHSPRRIRQSRQQVAAAIARAEQLAAAKKAAKKAS